MDKYYERDGITLYLGECSEVMRDILPDSHIDLTVTSPPYGSLRTYNGYTFDFEAIAKQLWRVTKPGGVVVWVVGDETIDGSETGESFRQALGFKDIGFRLHDTMIYQRVNLSYPQEGKYHHCFDYMFILSNGLTKTTNLIRDRKNIEANKKVSGTERQKNGQTIRKPCYGNIIPDYGLRFNIWKYATGNNLSTTDKLAFAHPAIFPDALARDHIISWSNPGDVVLDPMAGSGTVLKMAQALGRQAIGIEISEEYCHIIIDRLRQPSFFSLPVEPPPRGKPIQETFLGVNDDHNNPHP